MLDARILQLLRCFRRLQWQCDQPSWTASQTRSQKRVSNRVGSQCSARRRILLVCARFDSLSARLRGNENRGPRSEAWNSSKCLGLEGSGQGRRALRERAAGSINRSCGRETTTAAQPRAFQTHAYYRPYQNQARQEQKPHGRRVEQYPPGELITNQRPASAMAAAAAPGEEQRSDERRKTA